jgi:L-seryl-tRNA(Ser) seleniumtransferase
MSDQTKNNLRNVPSVDELLRSVPGRELRETIGAKRLTAIARQVTSTIRARMLNSAIEPNDDSGEQLLAEATQQMAELAQAEELSGIRHVINATGVVLHTNLGRAPVSDAARQAIDQASRFCTLEYDAATGIRGRRGARAEALLREFSGAEDALIVNNCAAAALLILTVLASDGETLVSRGQLVEIGGDFRIPDVMAASGTRMVEVGTTNRTHLEDFRRAITPTTRLVMRVHPSNYRIVGFAAEPLLPELSELATSAGLILYEDAGSGQLIDFSKYGVTDEPLISDLVKGGADVVSFSGDKLLGSVQAGLIVGKKRIVERLRKHPLYRALRSDKLRLAALEATLVELLTDQESAPVPVLQMLSTSYEELELRAELVCQQVDSTTTKLAIEKGESAIGGGAGPTSNLASPLIAISHDNLTSQEIEAKLRSSIPAVISRISDDKVLIDLRTVFPEEEHSLVAALKSL